MPHLECFIQSMLIHVGMYALLTPLNARLSAVLMNYVVHCREETFARD